MRRDVFLATAAGAVSLAGTGGFLVGREKARSSPGLNDRADLPADLSDWHEVRNMFELAPDVVPFASFLLAAHPRPVRAAVASFRDALDEDPVRYLHENEAELEGAVRQAAATHLATSSELIALTDSTTMGLALVYGGLQLRAGDEVVTSEHDFYATHEALRIASQRSGARLKHVRLYDDPAQASVDRVVSVIEAALSPRTRCLALTWVHSSSGVKLPLREIAALVRDANRNRDERNRVLLSIDGVHGFGVEETSPVALGCDLFITGCHKWLFGPRGTGLIWGSEAAWARIRPTIPSFDPLVYGAWLQDRTPMGVPAGRLMTPGGFHSFEHRWALSAAFELHERIGRDRIAERTRALAAQLKEGLTHVPGLTVKTPLDAQLSAGLVCFEVDGISAPEFVERLEAEHGVVASVTPYRTQYVRLGPSIVNTPAEIEQVLQAIRAFV